MQAKPNKDKPNTPEEVQGNLDLEMDTDQTKLEFYSDTVRHPFVEPQPREEGEHKKE